MQDYENTNTRIENDARAGHVLQVYRKRYGGGARVWLGGNGLYPGGANEPAMYTVVVYPATTLEPAYDSKPVTSYKATNARVAGDTVEWEIGVGVAVTLAPTPATKWNYLNSSTGTMINAGRYTVRLIAPLKEGCKVDELQVQ